MYFRLKGVSYSMVLFEKTTIYHSWCEIFCHLAYMIQSWRSLAVFTSQKCCIPITGRALFPNHSCSDVEMLCEHPTMGLTIRHKCIIVFDRKWMTSTSSRTMIERANIYFLNLSIERANIFFLNSSICMFPENSSARKNFKLHVPDWCFSAFSENGAYLFNNCFWK